MRLYSNYIIYQQTFVQHWQEGKFLISHFHYILALGSALLIVVLIAKSFLYAHIHNVLNNIFVALFAGCLRG